MEGLNTVNESAALCVDQLTYRMECCDCDLLY